MEHCPILAADRICRQFDGGVIIEIMQARIFTQSRLLISGPSGCGKSTVLGMLSLALKPDRAQSMIFCQQDILKLWRSGKQDQLAALRSKYLGFVPQTAELLPFLTLEENIALSQKLLKKDDPKWLMQLAERLDIVSVLKHKPNAVSVGQRQRAAIARALAHRPLLVLADEPTASVHPALADEILKLLVETVEDTGSALVMTSHNVDIGLAYGLKEAQCHLDPKTQITRLNLNG